ncbi:hypothetical protein FRC12_016750 [Ceratobasidium sp. 428]|nr:hypothetical protein FRC12_016750 [Ceratobasidium sp. 428]
MGFKNGIVIVAAAAAGVFAQGSWLGGASGLSPSCQKALNDAINGPGMACLDLRGPVDFLETQGINESLIPPVNSWLSSICSQPACTNATIDAVVSTITSGCRADLAQDNVTDAEVGTVVGYIKTYYAVAREVVCLKDSNASNQFCITDTLKRFEDQTGAPLTPNSLVNLRRSGFTLNSVMTKNVICTDCIKAMWNILKPHISSDDRAETESDIDGTCGSGFANSPTPASIQNTANPANQASSNSQNGGTTSTSVFDSMMSIALGAVGVFSLL